MLLAGWLLLLPAKQPQKSFSTGEMICTMFLKALELVFLQQTKSYVSQVFSSLGEFGLIFVGLRQWVESNPLRQANLQSVAQ